VSRTFSLVGPYHLVEGVKGPVQLTLTDEQIARRTHDAPAVIAEACGISEDQLFEHTEHAGRYRCQAKNAAGARCRNYLPGLQYPHPGEWIKNATEGYCRSHQNSAQGRGHT
jgi:hypothetical protein